MSTPTLKEALTEALRHVVTAKDTALKIIAIAPDSGHVAMMLEADLNKVINKLAHLGGVALVAETPVTYEPITLPGMVNLEAASFDPDEEEKQAFLAKVEKLFLEISSLSPDAVLAHEALVVRGVAKSAGVENYEEAELTVPYVEKIQAAVAEQLAALKDDEKVQQQIEAEKAQQALIERITEVSTKKDELHAEFTEKQQAAEALTGNEKKKAQKELKLIEDELKSAQDLLDDLNTQLTVLSA